MNTITLLGDHRDILFYAFLFAFIYFLILLHRYFEVKEERKANKRLFLTKEERDELMKKQVENSK